MHYTSEPLAGGYTHILVKPPEANKHSAADEIPSRGIGAVIKPYLEPHLEPPPRE